MKQRNGDVGRIEIDLRICFGKPVIRGTRIPVHQIIELLEEGYTPERIIRECYHRLTKRDVQAALHYAASLVKLEEVIPAAAR